MLTVVFVAAAIAAQPALAALGARTVRYHGYVVTVPPSWPVYDLSANPRLCVRFDRHALYLGAPGPAQSCPAHAAGRTEAILLEPLPADAPRAAARPHAPLPGLGRHATSFEAAGVLVTATWASGEAVVARALHRRTLPSAPRALPRPRRAVRAAHSSATIFNGLGFDACAAPSQTQMSAWGSSPYRAIGVYIGGANEACAQSNLTSSWVSTEVTAGWHLIPTYVGLQAPSNDCGCAGITPSQATSQGAAAANDAVAEAAAIGLPAGNPIYDDMEGYSRTSANTQAVMSFLSAWTSQLHADGYASGVYSSGGSGIADLASRYGTAYVEPDDIWIADWNGQQTTNDSYVPASDWSNQQRLHQYRGSHNETYGGVTINIDNDYLDGDTADTSSGTVNTQQLPSTPPAFTLTPLANGTTDVDASWNGAFGVSAWRVLAGFGATGSPFSVVGQAPAKSGTTQMAVRNGAPYFEVQALGSSGQVLGTSQRAATPPHLALLGPATFVSASGGFGTLPAACFTGQMCQVTLALRAGRALVASTGTESLGPNGGLLRFRLSSRGRALLARARGNRLPVQATVRASSGVAATLKVNVIAVSTSGRGPVRRTAQSSTVKLVNAVDYVSYHGAGGILAACHNAPMCQIRTTIKVGRLTVAHTGPEYLGANELGYLIFSLTSRGRALLRNARGNQLGAQLTLTSPAGSVTTPIVLVTFF